MIIQFNKAGVTDTGGAIYIKVQAFDRADDDSGVCTESPLEVVFILGYDVLEYCVGDHRGYWTREAYVKADEYWPMITSACAYASHRLPKILALSEPNYVDLLAKDFPGKPNTWVERDVDLTEETLKEALVDMREALKEPPPQELVENILDDWGLELTVEGDRGHGVEQFNGNKELAQDIVRELKEAGYL